MKNAGSAVRVVDGRISCSRCGVEMRRPKHSRLRGHLFCPKCGHEALYLKSQKKPVA